MQLNLYTWHCRIDGNWMGIWNQVRYYGRDNNILCMEIPVCGFEKVKTSDWLKEIHFIQGIVPWCCLCLFVLMFNLPPRTRSYEDRLSVYSEFQTLYVSMEDWTHNYWFMMGKAYQLPLIALVWLSWFVDGHSIGLNRWKACLG